jgi:hypothetical protein
VRYTSCVPLGSKARKRSLGGVVIWKRGNNPRRVQRPPISAIKLAMNKLGVPISSAVGGPALPAPPEAEEKVESVLREAGLLTMREFG